MRMRNNTFQMRENDEKISFQMTLYAKNKNYFFSFSLCVNGILTELCSYLFQQTFKISLVLIQFTDTPKLPLKHFCYAILCSFWLSYKIKYF